MKIYLDHRPKLNKVSTPTSSESEQKHSSSCRLMSTSPQINKNQYTILTPHHTLMITITEINAEGKQAKSEVGKQKQINQCYL